MTANNITVEDYEMLIAKFEILPIGIEEFETFYMSNLIERVNLTGSGITLPGAWF